MGPWTLTSAMMVFCLIRQNKSGIYKEDPESRVKVLAAHSQWKVTLAASTEVELLDIRAICLVFV